MNDETVLKVTFAGAEWKPSGLSARGTKNAFCVRSTKYRKSQPASEKMIRLFA